MEVYALFDDSTVEKVAFEFLQPLRKSERVDISYLNKVPDNIQESMDAGIKEMYFLLVKLYPRIPNKISIWFRGFQKNINGNSTDLAFSAALIAEIIEQYDTGITTPFKKVYATGYLNKDGYIEKVLGFENKLRAAVDNCDCHSGIFIYPEENEKELKDILLSDMNLKNSLEKSRLQIVSIRNLKDIFSLLKLSVKRCLKNIFYLITAAVILLLASSAFFYINLTKNRFQNNTFNPNKAYESKTQTTTLKPIETPTSTQFKPNATVYLLQQTSYYRTFSPALLKNKATPSPRQRIETSPTIKTNSITVINNKTIVGQESITSKHNTYQEYDDRSIKFIYPGSWEFKTDNKIQSQIIVGKSAWYNNIMITVSYSSNYIGDGSTYEDTTLDGIFKKVSGSTPIFFNVLNVTKLNNCIRINREDNFNNIMARGIKTIVPNISIFIAHKDSSDQNRFDYNIQPTSQDLRLLNQITDVISDTIKVIN
jgi:hypothetical protein